MLKVLNKEFFSKLEAYFIIIGLLFGLLFVFIVPPLQVPDENSHFAKAYQISQGRLVQQNTVNTSGGVFAGGLAEFLAKADANSLTTDTTKQYGYKTKTAELLKIKLSDGGPTVVEYPNLATYPPVAYLPQSIGILLTRIVTDRVMVIFYVARIFNLLAYLTLVYLAIKYAKMAKWAYFVIGLLPMSIFLAGSNSADAVTIGLIMLYSSILVRFYFKDKLTLRNWVVVASLVVLVGLCKQSYYMLSLAVTILLLSPGVRPTLRGGQDLRRRILYISLILFSLLVILVAWNYGIRNISTDVSSGQAAAGRIVDSHLQVSRIFDHPLMFVKSFINTFVTSQSNGIVLSFFGMFGWLNIPVPTWLVCFVAVLLFLSFGMGDTSLKHPMRWQPAGIMALSVLASFVLSCIALYITWTSSGARIIEGMQGRYFLPLIVMIAPTLCYRYSHTIRRRYVLFGSVFALTSSLFIIFARF